MAWTKAQKPMPSNQLPWKFSMFTYLWPAVVSWHHFNSFCLANLFPGNEKPLGKKCRHERMSHVLGNALWAELISLVSSVSSPSTWKVKIKRHTRPRITLRFFCKISAARWQEIRWVVKNNDSENFLPFEFTLRGRTNLETNSMAMVMFSNLWMSFSGTLWYFPWHFSPLRTSTRAININPSWKLSANDCSNFTLRCRSCEFAHALKVCKMYS